MSDGDSSTVDTERCIWCERKHELVTDEVAESYLISGPDGEVLEMEYGLVCPGCWDSIRDHWRQNGELTKPLSSYGGASA